MNDSALSAQCGSYGSEDCPCVLSTLKECLVCSHLQGKEFCDCEWNKYCVYINYLHNRREIQRDSRDFSVPVRHLVMGTSGLRVFLTVPQAVLDMAKNLNGALLRPMTPASMEIPAVVLSVYPEHGLLSLAVNPRSRDVQSTLLNAPFFELCPDESPAFAGLPLMQGITGQNVLVAAEEFGQLMVDSLIKNYLLPGNRVAALLSHNLPVISRKLEEMEVEYRVTGPMGGELLNRALGQNDFDVCCILGSSRLCQEAEHCLAGSGVAVISSPVDEIIFS